MARGNAEALAKARQAKAEREEAMQAVLQQVLASVQDFSTRVDVLEQRLTEAEAARPRMEPMKPYEPVVDKRAVPRLRAGEEAQGVQNQIPQSRHGWKPTRRARFGSGSHVRINPDVAREHAAKQWSEILADRGISGEGVVVRPLWQDDESGQWKYVVHIEGLTHSQFPDGFYDYELLPA